MVFWEKIILLLPEYPVNECFIIPNSISDEAPRYVYCCSLCLSGFEIIIGKIQRILNFQIHDCHVSLQWIKKILQTPRKYINNSCFTSEPEFIPSFSDVHVAWSLAFYVCLVDRCLSCCTFSFGHCVVCPSIYGFWLPLCYLQTLLS